MRKISYFTVFLLFFGFSVHSQSLTCPNVVDPLKAIRVLLYDHGGNFVVESDYFKLGRHLVNYKDVQAVYVDPKQQLRKTFWVRVVLLGGKVISIETKDSSHADDAVNAIKCLSSK